MTDEFAAAFSEYWPRIYQLAVRMTHNDDEAEEIAQETFFRAYRGWNRFEGRSSVGTWLYRIAVNTCKQRMIEKRKRQLQSLNEDPPGPMIEKDNRLAVLNLALEQIAPAHRLVLTLFYLEGLKHDDIANILEVPIGTVWSRLHKAKGVLESRIQELTRE